MAPGSFRFLGEGLLGDALGGTGRYLNVTVEATWVRFADAFRGEAADWRGSDTGSGSIVPSYFSLTLIVPYSQCWGQALLARYFGRFRRDTLPNEHFGWPSNIVVLGVLATDPAVLPLDQSVVNCWGAIRRGKVDEGKADSFLNGHVPLKCWLQWAQAADFAKIADGQEDWHEDADMDVFGPLRRSVRDDLKRLTAIGQSLGEEDEAAMFQARKIRIEWPRDYSVQEQVEVPINGRDTRSRLDRSKNDWS